MKKDCFLTFAKEYPENPPFNPPEKYPEYPYEKIDINNQVYGSIRDLLIKLGLDESNYGKENWNPLGDIIKPDDDVVIKPNFVSEPRSKETNFESIMTHTSVIRPILDYCQIALKGEGSLVIADAPQFDSDFELIKKITKIEDTLESLNQYSRLKVDLLDLRQERVVVDDGIISKRFKINGDPKGYVKVDLGENSEFYSIEDYLNRIYGADYDFEETRNHHSSGKHEYCISKTILNSDVIINVPKLKTHKKAGITVCLKNMVGINGNKNYLPHFRFGSINEGGDEFPGKSVAKGIISNLQMSLLKSMSKMGTFQKELMRLFGRIYLRLGSKNPIKFQNGNWYGNDTIWRTIIDLNKILFYADTEGVMQEDVQRKYLAIVDGIVGGENDGPLFPASKPCGILLGGFNPFLVDLTAAKLMGFDWKKIPTIKNAENLLPNTNIVRNTKNINFYFKPSPKWDFIVK